MNLEDLGLDEGLLRALQARGADTLYPFLEKTVHHVNGKKESVSAQVRTGSGREFLYMVPLLQWLLTEGAGERALVVLTSDQDVASARSQTQALAEAVGIPVHAVGRDPDPADAAAPLSMGAAEVLAGRQEEGTLDLKGYRFLVVDGAERFTESPRSAQIRKLRSFLAPSRERRTIVFAEKLGIKEQTLALDLADAPTELYLEEEAEKVKHVPQATWYVATDSKMKLLLGVLSREARAPAAVFCNLRESAEETARRLSANGRKVEFILGNLPRPRKETILSQARSGELEAIVLTDEGAQGLPRGVFPLVVNYDIPLEGEPYLERLRLLDVSVEGARVVNFACDRYVYGIPAVEQFMGISLGAVQADEALFAAEDRSAGMAFGRGRGSGGGAPRERDNRRSRGNDRDYRRDRNERGRDGDPRNQESIRAGIAELTGVNLGGSGARNRPPESPSPRERQGPDRSFRNDGQGRGGRRSKHGRRGGSQGGPSRAAGPSPQSSFPDPYAIPMEERMRLYREKYGKRLTEDKPPKPAGRKKGRRRRGGAPGSKGAPDAAGEGMEGRGEAVDRPPEAHGDDHPGPEAAGSRIGRFFGALRKEKDE